MEYGAWPFRYVWPAELDLMAELAGLRLRDRFGGWDRSLHQRQPEAHLGLGEGRLARERHAPNERVEILAERGVWLDVLPRERRT